MAWPALVPRHDTLHDAWVGVAAVGRQSVFLSADGMPAVRLTKQPPNLKQARTAAPPRTTAACLSTTAVRCNRSTVSINESNVGKTSSRACLLVYQTLG